MLCRFASITFSETAQKSSMISPPVRQSDVTLYRADRLSAILSAKIGAPVRLAWWLTTKMSCFVGSRVILPGYSNADTQRHARLGYLRYEALLTKSDSDRVCGRDVRTWPQF